MTDLEHDIETPTTDVVEAPHEEVTAPETETTPAEPKTYTSWQDALADADPEELLRDDRIAGRIGQVADKRAREIAKQNQEAADARAQDERDRAETQRLRELRSENPMAYANEMERRDLSAEAIAAEAARQARLGGDITGELERYVTANYPKEVYETLAGKTYPGTLAQGVAAYYGELDKANRAHLRAQWEKDERPALRKQILAELNGNEPSIDSSSGGTRSGKKFNSNLEASQALMDGQIDLNEYTRQSRTNGWR